MSSSQIVGLVVVIVIVVVLLIIICIHRSHKHIKAKDTNIQNEKESKKRNKASKVVCLVHMAGLPVSEGSQCILSLMQDSIIIHRNKNSFSLPFDKISDMCIKSETEIQKAYVSSIGGAVGGAFLFGPLGAMIGGRTKTKTNKTVRSFFIITYHSDNEVKYISFDCTGSLGVYKFVSTYNRYPKNQTSVEL